MIRFAPGADPFPPTLGEEASAPGSIVLLLDASGDPLWAADAAIALAQAWGQAGRRIVLADLHLEEPVLHERIGVANHDGVVDIFLYGASLKRSARPVRGRGFYLIPAGTYTADAGALFHHPRWAKLTAGFRDARAALLLFVPGDAPALEALAQWSTGAILLGEPEPALSSLVPDGVPLHLTLAPPLAPTHPPSEEEAAPAEEGGLATVPQEAAAGEDKQPEVAQPQPRAAPRLLWVAALAIVALIGASYLAAHLRPELFGLGIAADPDLRAAQGAPLAGAAGAAAASAPAGVLLPYAVHLRAFRTLSAAREQLTQEERRLRGQPVYISPELIQGVRWYRVLVGLPADSAAAVRLRERLVESGAIDREDIAGSLTLIQYTPLAFHLGDFAGRQAAAARADSLLERGIPSYPAPLPYSDGSTRWRLYGGAYADSAQAEEMQELLTEAGVQAALVERIGQPANDAP